MSRLHPDRHRLLSFCLTLPHVFIACLALTLGVSSARVDPFRLPHSPYAAPTKGPNCTRTLYIFDDTLLSQTQVLTLQTLQGIVARTCPTLLRTGSGQPTDMQSRFAADLAAYGVQLNTTLRGSFSGLLQLHKSSIRGYALCNAPSESQAPLSLESMFKGSTSPHPRVVPPANADISCNVAIALAAANEGVVAVAVPDEAAVAALGIPRAYDARTMTPQDVLRMAPMGRVLSATSAILQAPEKYTFLSDYGPFARAFTFWDDGGSLPSPLSHAVLDAFQPPAAVLGWGSSEGGSVDTLAAFGSYIHAADWAPNLATFTSFFVSPFRQARAPSPPPAVPGRHAVTFLMTDGDNVQWLLNTFGSPLADWFGSAKRGEVPIGWTVSPAMAELAPSVLQRFYGQMVAGKDNFVAGPSGVGYTVPDKFNNDTALDAFAALTGEYLQRADLNIVNLIADTDCDLQCAQPFARHGAEAIFLYEGSGYVGRGGKLTWAGDAPVVGGRFALWGQPGDGFEDPVSLARKLRRLPKDAHNPDSYSLIPVHVWTHNVSDVIRTVALLGDYFDILTPGDLVARMKANIFHDCSAAQPATGPYQSSCHGGTDTCGVLRDVQCDDGKGHRIPNPFFDHTSCQAVSNCFGHLQCEGAPCSCPNPATGSFTQSCTGCVDSCGLLTGCSCGGGGTSVAASLVPPFNYTVCQGQVVANCYDALICQGQPCA